MLFSGFATPRWANLPYLDVIRERNKPVEPPQRPKSAPFFLASVPTVDGFAFQPPEQEETTEDRKVLIARRNMLEIETSFTKSLLQ